MTEIIRAHDYPNHILTAWLQANGAPALIPEDCEITIEGDQASAVALDVGLDEINDPEKELPGWRNLEDPTLTDIYPSSVHTWKITRPISVFLEARQ